VWDCTASKFDMAMHGAHGGLALSPAFARQIACAACCPAAIASPISCPYTIALSPPKAGNGVVDSGRQGRGGEKSDRVWSPAEEVACACGVPRAAAVSDGIGTAGSRSVVKGEDGEETLGSLSDDDAARLTPSSSLPAALLCRFLRGGTPNGVHRGGVAPLLSPVRGGLHASCPPPPPMSPPSSMPEAPSSRRRFPKGGGGVSPFIVKKGAVR